MRRAGVAEWAEVLGSLVATVIMLDAHTGGALRRWVQAQITPPVRVRESDHVYGMAREASRYTKAAAEGG